MFNWQEHTRITSRLSYSALLDRVAELFDQIGDVNMTDDGEFSIRTQRYNSFAYEAKFDGEVDRRKKGQDDYDITLRWSMQPTVGAIVITVFFWPVGLIFFLQGSNAKQDLQRRIRDAFRDIEDELDEGD